MGHSTFPFNGNRAAGRRRRRGVGVNLNRTTMILPDYLINYPKFRSTVVVNMMVKRNRLTQSRQVAKGKEKLGVFATWRDSIISLTITEIQKY
ncbi:MAG: hypothetical protein R3A44_38020 [Caldilineaceae bacterium]